MQVLVELEPDAARALLKLSDRIGWAQLRGLLDSEIEARAARSALDEFKWSLAASGHEGAIASVANDPVNASTG
ncbi:MAG: hypothetical protein AAGF57_08480 [Pseudomonadota bacterium]